MRNLTGKKCARYFSGRKCTS